MKDLLKAAFIRSLWTFCEVAVAIIGTASLFSEVDWFMVLNASILGFIVAFLKCMITGLPEVKYGRLLYQYHDEPVDSEVKDDDDE